MKIRALVCAAYICASGAFAEEIELDVVRGSAAMDGLVPASATLEKIADGFIFIEGPVWRGDHLLFSDIPANKVYRWDADSGEVTVEIPVIHDPSIDTGARGGSNGLLLDSAGRLVLFEHGMRRVARVDTDGERRPIATHHAGQRLNSPNDGVYHSSGSLFFTDPPYGLPQGDADPGKEVEQNGIYRLDPDGSVHLVAQMHRPNGIGLSPDESVLYVASSDMERKWWRRFPVNDDLSVGEGEMHFDARHIEDFGVPDGFDVDRSGNIWASGPGGIVVIAPDGTHVGTVRVPEQPANATFDDAEQYLYITARSGLYRLELR